MFKKKQSNPYEFVRMVKWCSTEGRFEGYVGYTKDGNIYLTWDVRKDIPIFSENCKIGNDLRIEDFRKFEELYRFVENRWIEQVSEITYEILRSKQQFKFKEQDHALHYSGKPIQGVPLRYLGRVS